MNIKKPLLVLGAVTGIGLAGVTGLGIASAATNSSDHEGIIGKLAAHFNLKQDDVKAVFEEYHGERQAERQQKAEERLTQAVADGKITEEQKTKILAKLEELKAIREQWKDKTPEERHQAMQELHSTLEQWAEDNGIPMQYLHFGMHHHGPGHGHGIHPNE